METPFRLLVYTIVTITIIGLIYILLAPILFPVEDNIDAINKSLKASETGLGKSFPVNLFVREGEGFAGETFDSRFRNVVFQCNSASLCCPREKDCDLAIEWDNRILQFNKQTTVLTTTRCDREFDLFTCTIYAGIDPAQVEINSVKSDEEFNLNQSLPKFEISFSNTGSQKAEQTEIEIEIFQRYLEDGRWIEKVVENSKERLTLGSLESGKSTDATITVNLNQNGEFKAKIRVSGLEAGFAEKVVQFSATGAGDVCLPAYCDKPSFSNQACTTRCHCQDCMSGTVCSDLLLKADNLDLGLHPDINLKNATPSILGSNIIDMALPANMCPSDIALKEPSAIAGEIGFKVKNVAGNPIQNSFKVNAYLDQQNIGSVDVLPNEIDEDSEVIKSIIVNLSPGTYKVRVVANENKTEKEDNYGNNSVEVEVTIPVPSESEANMFENPTNIGPCCGLPFELIGGFVSDSGTSITLREAISQGKVRADFVADGLGINAKMQNLTAGKLRIRIPLGQIYVEKTRQAQNLGSAWGDKIVEMPMCGVWIGSTSNACLNRFKNLPSFHKFDVGEIIQDQSVISALIQGDQSRVWDSIDTISLASNSYGNEGNILAPVPTDLMNKLEFTPEECQAAGFGIIPTCDTWEPLDYTDLLYPDLITDPDSIDPTYCSKP